MSVWWLLLIVPLSVLAGAFGVCLALEFYSRNWMKLSKELDDHMRSCPTCSSPMSLMCDDGVEMLLEMRSRS